MKIYHTIAVNHYGRLSPRNTKNIKIVPLSLAKYSASLFKLPYTTQSCVVVITTAQLHSTNPELRFCAGSNPARGVSEIRDGEDL